MFEFTDKVVVVTGAEKGIGRAAAHEFARAGAKVVIPGIDESDGRTAASEAPGEASFIRVDVSNEEEVAALPERIESTYGLTGVLVNNAGIIVPGDVLATDFQTWRKVLSVNLDGTFLVTKYLLPHMQRRGGGVIVNVGSEAGLVGFKGQVAYNVSKAGVIHLTRSLAVDFADQNIRANAVCPGTTYTPLVEDVINNAEDPGAMRRSLESIRPMNRLGQPVEIARAILALASDDIGYATGAIFSVDGGSVAQ